LQWVSVFHSHIHSLNLSLLVLNPAVKFEYLKENWEPAEVEAARTPTLAAVSCLCLVPIVIANIPQMAVHSQLVRLSPVMTRPPLRGSGLSERNLNHAVTSLSALAAKLKSRSTTPQPDTQPTTEPPSDEEQTQLRREAIQRELELELRGYTDEPVLSAETDTSFHTILSYWKVCMFFIIPRLHTDCS